MTQHFELLPAIDIASGKSVRLSQGKETDQVEKTDPAEVAQSFADSGTEWIHLVDLDQAFRKGNNSLQIAKIVSEFSNIKFQLSGGIANRDSFLQADQLKPARINISALALENLNWLEQLFQDKENLTFSLDVLDGEVVPRGSKSSFGNLTKVLRFLDSVGCKRYVVTDVSRDGMLFGPNTDLLREVFDLTGRPTIASGGISSLGDILSLLSLANYLVSGAILGKALYVGNFTLTEALQLVSSNE